METLKRKAQLEKIYEEKILKDRVIWQKKGFNGTVDLGDGITADLFGGAEEHDTAALVSDGLVTICHEIPDYWLANWEVAIDQPEKHT